MENIILKRFKESSEVKTRFLKENLPKLLDAVKLISHAFEAGNKLFFFGNGGSAAEAQHLAAEFVNRYVMDRPPLPAMALTTDTSILTSISNDFAFNDIFAKQLRALGKEGDVAIGITTSGSSPNVIKAFEVAKEMGMKTIALTGNNGGILLKMVDLPLIVPSTSTPRIQEVHILIGHILCEMVEHSLFFKVNP
jgi:D-sedoheptulose 7-phosphate isomerase